MWYVIVGVVVIYTIFKFFFYKDDVTDIETSDSSAKFKVATRLEKLFGGKVYIGLRLPDADTATRQNIDMVLVTQREVVVIDVMNASMVLAIDHRDGTWLCSGGGKDKYKTEKLPDPLVEIKKQAAVLEAYLEQRGVSLPEGYVSCKVVLSNPKTNYGPPIDFPPEVISYDQWIKLKPEPKSMFSGWIKGAGHGGKKEMQESVHKQLHSVLSTAPTWDRLELKGSKNYLGEFLDFKGKSEDLQVLKNIKRSKVSQLIIQKTSMLGLAPSKLQALYCARNYQNEGASDSDWTEITVRSSTEVLFQPQNSSKVRKFRLSSVSSLSLSA